MKKPILYYLTYHFKRVLILFVFFTFSNCSKIQEDKENNLKKANLKGKVKSFTETAYEVAEHFGNAVEIFGNIEKRNKVGFSLHYNFDENGNQIEFQKKFYEPNDSLNEKTICKYDTKGIKIEESHYKSNGSLLTKILYKYDWNGNQIESNIYSDESLISNYTYKFIKPLHKIYQ